MGWNGLRLSWGNIVYEQIKVELSRKHTRSPVKLHSTIYISNLTKPPRYLIDNPVPPQNDTGRVNLTEEEAEENIEPLKRRGKKPRTNRSPPSSTFQVRPRPRGVNLTNLAEAGPSVINLSRSSSEGTLEVDLFGTGPSCESGS